jgi:hypothetical protein
MQSVEIKHEGRIGISADITVTILPAPLATKTGVSSFSIKSCTGTTACSLPYGCLSLVQLEVDGFTSTPTIFEVFHLFVGLGSLFRPGTFWWRIVIMVRKFCIVGVALMFSSTPLFQAW